MRGDQTTWAVMPVKCAARCKTRLSPRFDAVERARLVSAMLQTCTQAAIACLGTGSVRILGPSLHGMEQRIERIADPGGGLNAALDHARKRAMAAGVDRLLLVSPDLPRITAQDLAAMLDAPRNTLAIAPDRSGTGTNAILLPLPTACRFRLQFGEASLKAHLAEARRLDLTAIRIERPGLAHDIDTPDDFFAWQACTPNADTRAILNREFA